MDTNKGYSTRADHARNPGTGKLMICALTHDDPKETCGQGQENQATKFNVRGRGFLTLLLMYMLYEVFGRGGAQRLRARAFHALRRLAISHLN